jgi:hypothetical protein
MTRRNRAPDLVKLREDGEIFRHLEHGDNL